MSQFQIARFKVSFFTSLWFYFTDYLERCEWCQLICLWILETLAISPGLIPDSCHHCSAWSHAILAYLWMLSRTGKSLNWAACKRKTLGGWGDLVSNIQWVFTSGFSVSTTLRDWFSRSAGKMKFWKRYVDLRWFKVICNLALVTPSCVPASKLYLNWPCTDHCRIFRLPHPAISPHVGGHLKQISDST